MSERSNAAAAASVAPSDEVVDKVTSWRLQELERMGFEPYVALQLASDRGVDIHRVAAVLERGCSLAQAVQIFS